MSFLVPNAREDRALPCFPTEPAPPPMSPQASRSLPITSSSSLYPSLPLTLPPSFPAFVPPRRCQWPPLRSRFSGTLLSPLIRFLPRSIIEAALSRPMPPIFVSVSVHYAGVGSPPLNPFLHPQQLFYDTSFSLSPFSTFYIAWNGPSKQIPRSALP